MRLDDGEYGTLRQAVFGGPGIHGKRRVNRPQGPGRQQPQNEPKAPEQSRKRQGQAGAEPGGGSAAGGIKRLAKVILPFQGCRRIGVEGRRKKIFKNQLKVAQDGLRLRCP